jgi:cytochrome c oxidase subunit II
MTGFELFPPRASSQAWETDLLYLFLVLASAAIVILIVALVVVFSIRYRRGSAAPRPELRLLTTREFEIGWTAATFFLFLFIFAWSGSVRLSMLAPPQNAIEIHIEGKQWMWKVQHPNGTREINSLHIPVNEPVRLIMTSQDVIHSFFVPAFRIKQDVVPGRYTQTWFKATKAGTQHLFCSQFCGTQHSRMVGEIVVMSPDDYARWLREQAPQGDLVAEGAALFRSLGCSECHDNPAIRAPRLAGIYGTTVQLAGGGTAKVDDDYLRDCIIDPEKHVPLGYEPLMPSFKDQVSSDDILRLIAYIRSLHSTGLPG